MLSRSTACSVQLENFKVLDCQSSLIVNCKEDESLSLSPGSECNCMCLCSIHELWVPIPAFQITIFKSVCTTEIKCAASSVCLRRIVALCGLGVYECGLGVYVVRPGVYGVPSQQILYSARPSRAKTGFPAHSVVQTSYTTPTLTV